MKTVKEWFESIKDEDVRKRALKNMTCPDYDCYTLRSALGNGFIWDDTDEGQQYWAKIHDKAQNNEL